MLEAKDGIEALEFAARHEGTIHVTLTDMIMPRMSGAELVKRLKAIRPDTKAAYMTGYAEYLQPLVIRTMAVFQSAEFDTRKSHFPRLLWLT